MDTSSPSSLMVLNMDRRQAVELLAAVRALQRLKLKEKDYPAARALRLIIEHLPTHAPYKHIPLHPALVRLMGYYLRWPYRAGVKGVAKKDAVRWYGLAYKYTKGMPEEFRYVPISTLLKSFSPTVYGE